MVGSPTALDGGDEQRKDLLVTPEVGDVAVGQVDSPCDSSGPAEGPELYELALTAGHFSGG